MRLLPPSCTPEISNWSTNDWAAGLGPGRTDGAGATTGEGDVAATAGGVVVTGAWAGADGGVEVKTTGAGGGVVPADGDAGGRVATATTTGGGGMKGAGAGAV